MTPQLEEVHRLLRLARRDAETFYLLLPLQRASMAALGFHVQQAAEKSLKAAAVLHGLQVRRTHDLAALGQAILEQGKTLPLTVEQLRGLNPFAVEFRYDDEIEPAATRDELDFMLSAILRWARHLVDE